jgi:hypothetical protein
VSWSVALCSCIEWRVMNAWIVGVEVVGGIYSPQPPKAVVGGGCCRWAHRTVRCATELCLVRQPRYPTVRVRTQMTVGALSSYGTGQALFTVRCASSGCSDFCAHCPLTVALQASVAVDRCAGSRCSAWCTGQSGEL